MGKSREHKRCHAREARSRRTWSLERRLHQSQPLNRCNALVAGGFLDVVAGGRNCGDGGASERHLGCFHLPLLVFIHSPRTPRIKAAATTHDHLCTCDGRGGGQPPRNSGGGLLRPVRIKRKKKKCGQIRPLQPAVAPPSPMLVLALMRQWPPWRWRRRRSLALPLPRATTRRPPMLPSGHRSEGVGCGEKWRHKWDRLWGAVVTVTRGRLQGAAAVAARDWSCGGEPAARSEVLRKPTPPL
jgi:hypothetical protein